MVGTASWEKSFGFGAFKLQSHSSNIFKEGLSGGKMKAALKNIVLVAGMLIISSASWANLLILEYRDSGEGAEHGDAVKYVACQNQVLGCELLFSEFQDETFKNEVENKIPSRAVVNMSFVLQRPFDLQKPPYQRWPGEAEGVLKEQENHDSSRKALEDIMTGNQDVLFVAAAGNGYRFLGIFIKGVPLGERYPMYPALNEMKNLVKVTALNEDSLNYDSLETYSRADYANYSLWTVDLAAIVEKGDGGELLEGTSFAAPYVARLALEIQTDHQELSPVEIKEILTKTSFVKSIDRAIWATEDVKKNGKASIVSQAHLDKKSSKRADLRNEVGDILFVKSGGIVIPEAAKMCANIYVGAAGVLTIGDACLEAQEQVLSASDERQEKLKKLWKLRAL